MMYIHVHTLTHTHMYTHLQVVQQKALLSSTIGPPAQPMADSLNVEMVSQSLVFL